MSSRAEQQERGGQERKPAQDADRALEQRQQEEEQDTSLLSFANFMEQQERQWAQEYYQQPDKPTVQCTRVSVRLAKQVLLRLPDSQRRALMRHGVLVAPRAQMLQHQHAHIYAQGQEQQSEEEQEEQEEELEQRDKHETMLEEEEWKLQIRLSTLSKHALWGHMIWNASRELARMIAEKAEVQVEGKKVLELGAGAALPSLTALLCGAQYVLATDYPDEDLVENMRHSMKENIPSQHDAELNNRWDAVGYSWGENMPLVLGDMKGCTDYVFLSDVTNHLYSSMHMAILDTCDFVLRPGEGKILCIFSHHEPRKAERTNRFVENAIARGYTVHDCGSATYAPMFTKEEDYESRSDEERKLMSVVNRLILTPPSRE